MISGKSTIVACLALCLAGCTSDTGVGPDICATQSADGWSEDSHGDSASLDYELVLDDSVVHRIDISLCSYYYQQMQDDMTEKYGEFGAGTDTGPPPPARAGEPAPEAVGDPIYVPVQVEFEGKVWPYVGMRYKGNSSLKFAWQNGNPKLPFRLNFDKYEDEYEEVDNQRFWGFKELKFGSNYHDNSVVRDKVAAETFRAAGVPAARGAFYRVYVDTGEGSVYWGLYTAFEDPASELLESWFGSDSGNCYKPENGAANWTYFDSAFFEKKTNEEEADWSDIQGAIEALLDDASDAATWRANLEARFDVYLFLRYLALNNLISNWDVYGNAAHNYYLYGDPAQNGLLTWIPWDFNEGYKLTTTNRTPVSLTADEVTDEWPLIRRLMDDPVYQDAYYTELDDAINGVFSLQTQFTLMDTFHELVAPYVIGEEGEVAPYTSIDSEEEFVNSLTTGADALKPVVESQRDLAITLLSARSEEGASDE